MKEEKINPANVIENFDQMEQTLINFSAIVSGYYYGLLENRIPIDLAYSLVLEWHRIFWTSQVNSEKK